MSSNPGSSTLVLLLILVVVIDLGGRVPPRVDFDANGDDADDADDDVLDGDGGSDDTSSSGNGNGWIYLPRAARSCFSLRAKLFLPQACLVKYMIMLQWSMAVNIDSTTVVVIIGDNGSKERQNPTIRPVNFPQFEKRKTESGQTIGAIAVVDSSNKRVHACSVLDSLLLAGSISLCFFPFFPFFPFFLFLFLPTFFCPEFFLLSYSSCPLLFPKISTNT